MDNTDKRMIEEEVFTDESTLVIVSESPELSSESDYTFLHGSILEHRSSTDKRG